LYSLENLDSQILILLEVFHQVNHLKSNNLIKLKEDESLRLLFFIFKGT
ncbi:unnamed protein product, partial [marine sediment metagenome]